MQVFSLTKLHIKFLLLVSPPCFCSNNKLYNFFVPSWWIPSGSHL